MLKVQKDAINNVHFIISIKSYVLYIILSLLVALAFANSLRNEFVWDDNQLIINNPKINLSLKEIPLVFTTPLWKLGGVVEFQQTYYRPIASLFSVLNYKVWGLNPLGFHLTHIILHLINAIVLYRIGLLLFTIQDTRCTTGEERREKDEGRGTNIRRPSSIAHHPSSIVNHASWIAFFAASIFAVHPVHNESVGRVAIGEVIFGFFVILSIYFFLKEKKYLSWFMFIFALFSKEAAVMLPFALVILTTHREGIKKGLIALIPYMILVGVYLILRSQVVDTVFGDKVSQPIFTRILTMLVATFDYIRLLLIPYPVSPFYPARWYASIFEPKVLIAIVVLALISYLAFKMRRDKVMLFLLSFPFVMLAPVIWRVNTFPIENEFVYIAERYLYVPVMSFCFFASRAVIKFFGKKKWHLISLWILVIILFSVITITSNNIWRDDITLFSRIIKESPNALFAHINIGGAFYKKKSLNEAIQAYETVIRLNPYSKAAMNAHSSIGAIYVDQGRLSEAVSEFRKVLRIDYNNAYAHNNLGNVYYVQKRFKDAIQEYGISIELKPDNIVAHRNIAAAYVEIGETDKGIQHYRIALQMFPNDAETHNNLGLAYKQKGLISEAREEFKKALWIDNNFVEARQNLESLTR
jgi:Tfp pilus assembly protein PilF